MSRLVLVVPAILLAGCVPPTGFSQNGEVRMVDPRTGIIAICPPGQQTIDPARSELAACIAELRHYGFGIEQEVMAAHEPPPGAARQPAPSAQSASLSYGGSAAPVYAAPLAIPFGGSSVRRGFARDTLDADDLPNGRPWYQPDGASTARP